MSIEKLRSFKEQYGDVVVCIAIMLKKESSVIAYALNNKERKLEFSLKPSEVVGVSEILTKTDRVLICAGGVSDMFILGAHKQNPELPIFFTPTQNIKKIQDHARKEEKEIPETVEILYELSFSNDQSVWRPKQVEYAALRSLIRMLQTTQKQLRIKVEQIYKQVRQAQTCLNVALPEGNQFDLREEQGLLMSAEFRSLETDTERKIVAMLKTIPVYNELFEPLPSIGPKTAAILISQIQDPSLFENVGKIIKLSGFHCDKNGRAARKKAGEQMNSSPMLKQALYIWGKDVLNKQSAKNPFKRVMLARKLFDIEKALLIIATETPNISPSDCKKWVKENSWRASSGAVFNKASRFMVQWLIKLVYNAWCSYDKKGSFDMEKYLDRRVKDSIENIQNRTQEEIRNVSLNVPLLETWRKQIATLVSENKEKLGMINEKYREQINTCERTISNNEKKILDYKEKYASIGRKSRSDTKGKNKTKIADPEMISIKKEIQTLESENKELARQKKNLLVEIKKASKDIEEKMSETISESTNHMQKDIQEVTKKLLAQWFRTINSKNGISVLDLTEVGEDEEDTIAS